VIHYPPLGALRRDSFRRNARRRFAGIVQSPKASIGFIYILKLTSRRSEPVFQRRVDWHPKTHLR
jgi:hypothetical protein